MMDRKKAKKGNSLRAGNGSSEEPMKKSKKQIRLERERLEMVQSTDTAIPSAASKKSKPKGVVSTHKDEISSLKEKDPEFFQFLTDNDAQALNFGQDESDEDDFYEDDEIVDDDNDETEAIKPLDEPVEDVAAPAAIDITLTMVASVVKKSVGGSYEATKKLVSMFKAACIPNEDTIPEADDENDVGGEQLNTNNRFIISSAEIYNEVIVSAQDNLHVAFRNILGLSLTAKLDINSIKAHGKWKKVQLLVLSFYKSMLYCLDKSLTSRRDDGQIVAYLVNKLEPYIPFLISMPRLSKATLKTLLAIWSQEPSEEQKAANARGHAFLRIRQMARALPGAMLEECFRSTYLTFSRSCKTYSESSAGTILFMTECVSALYAIDVSMAYQQAFLYIRQLALHLRSALAKNSADSVKLVGSWHYVNCIRLWTKVVCSMPANSELGALAYPLTQIIFGVFVATPSPYYLPLRFHLTTSLHQLAAHCQLFIPTAAKLLEVLENPELFSKPSGSTEVAPRLKYLVKLPTDSLGRANVRDTIVSEVISLLSHDAEIYRHNVGFPEYAFMTIRKLRAFAKKAKQTKWRDLSRALVSQLEEISTTVKNARVSSVPISDKLESLLPIGGPTADKRLGKLLSGRFSSVSLQADVVTLSNTRDYRLQAADTGKKRSRSAKENDDVESDNEEQEIANDDLSGDSEDDRRNAKAGASIKKQKKSEKKESKKQKKCKSVPGKPKLHENFMDTSGLNDKVDDFCWSDDEA